MIRGSSGGLDFRLLDISFKLAAIDNRREKEKKNKYLPLSADMAKVHCTKVEIYPVVIGCLGCFGYLRKI